MNVIENSLYTDGIYLYTITNVVKISDPVKSVMCGGFIIHFLKDGENGQFTYNYFNELVLTRKLKPYAKLRKKIQF